MISMADPMQEVRPQVRITSGSPSEPRDRPAWVKIAVTEAVNLGSEALAKSSLRLLAVARQQPSKAHGR